MREKEIRCEVCVQIKPYVGFTSSYNLCTKCLKELKEKLLGVE